VHSTENCLAHPNLNSQHNPSELWSKLVWLKGKAKRSEGEQEKEHNRWRSKKRIETRNIFLLQQWISTYMHIRIIW
jgi:hypothetical protein